MKKHINIIMVAMLMALSFNTPGAEGDFIDPNLQVIKFNLWATVCPNNQADLVTVWVPWRTRALGFLMGNEPQGSSVAPDQFRIITVGDWRYLCVNPSGTVPMWLGELKASTNPQRGNRICWPLQIEACKPFSLADVSIVVRSSDPANWLGYSLAVGSYAPEIIGIYWGTDQVKGTADDVTRTSGVSTLPVNELYYVGLGVSGGAENQSGLNAIMNYVNANNSPTAPFTITCSVELKQSGNIVAKMTRALPFRGDANSSLTISKNSCCVSARVNGRVGQYYYLQSTPNFTPPVQWTDFPTPPILAGESFPIDKSYPQRYFRTRQ